MAAIGLNGDRQGAFEAQQPAIDEFFTGFARQHGPGQGGGHRALGGADRAVDAIQQVAGLAGEIEGDQGDLSVGGPGAQGGRRAGDVEGPPLQHLRRPGKPVPAAEHPAPVQGQAQALRRAGVPGGEQVGHPVEAVQDRCEPPRGAGSIPGIAAGSGLQGRAAEHEAAIQDAAAGFRIDGAGIARTGRQALRARPGQQPAMQGVARPFPAHLTPEAVGKGEKEDSAGQARQSRKAARHARTLPALQGGDIGGVG